MADDRFLFGYFLARRNAKPWKAGPRKRPKMPSGPWRAWALVTFAAGALIAWAIFRDGDTGTVVVRMLTGGAVGFGIGMLIVETVWERRHARNQPPESPIDPRT